LYDKRISHEVEGEHLGDEFKGYVFRISGGNDKQGFPMKQGILSNLRVRMLFSKGKSSVVVFVSCQLLPRRFVSSSGSCTARGCRSACLVQGSFDSAGVFTCFAAAHRCVGHSCFRERRAGERKRKSVRGCIVGADLSVLNLVVVKKGEGDIPGLTDAVKPRRLGPKRVSHIRKLFNLTKKDDVRQYVIRRSITKDGKKPYTKAPKIQRLITPQRLQHRRQIRAEKRQRWEKSATEAKEYNEKVTKLMKDNAAKKAAAHKKRSVSHRESAKP